MEYKSVFNSPRKYYRWFRYNLGLSPNFEPLVEISLGYSLIPRVIDGKICWITPHFKLKTLDAFSFGGRTTISYHVVSRSRSIFSFRSLLKKEGVIKNLYKENKEVKEKMNNPVFKKLFKLGNNHE